MHKKIIINYIKEYYGSYKKEDIIQALVDSGYSHTLVLSEYEKIAGKTKINLFGFVFLLLIIIFIFLFFMYFFYI